MLTVGIGNIDSFLFGGSLRGPLAVPGTYEVRLSAGGDTLRRSFTIKKDPRLDSTAEDFRKQFDLLIQIRDAVSSAHDGASMILAIRKRLDAVGEQLKELSGGESIHAQAEKLNENLTHVLNELVELRFRGIDDQMLVYPLKLNVAIASLQRAAASADRAPTDQTYTVFNERSAELDARLAELEEIVGKEIPALNRLLREKGLAEIRAQRED